MKVEFIVPEVLGIREEKIKVLPVKVGDFEVEFEIGLEGKNLLYRGYFGSSKMKKQDYERARRAAEFFLWQRERMQMQAHQLSFF